MLKKMSYGFAIAISLFTLTAGEQLPIKTAEELRLAAVHLLQPFNPTRPKTSRDFDEGRLFIIQYLNHSNNELQSTACDILAQCRRPIRGSAFREYLDSRFPLQIRIIALSYVMRNARGNDDDLKALTNDDLRANYKGMLVSTLNDICDSQISPKYLDVLAESIGESEALRIMEVIDKDRQSILFKRILLDFAHVKDREARLEIITCLTLFSAAVFESEWMNLYKVETQGGRTVLNKILIEATKFSRIPKASARKLLNTAVKDWDFSISKDARECLDKL